MEIAVPRARFDEIAQRFPEVDFHVPVAGALVPASPDTLAAGHQTWALDRAAGRWRFDVFREPHHGDVWICRRDARVRRPYADLIRQDGSGLPFLAPEVALLFKAKAVRDKDCADFYRSSTQPSAGGSSTRWRWCTRTTRGGPPSHESADAVRTIARRRRFRAPSFNAYGSRRVRRPP